MRFDPMGPGITLPGARVTLEDRVVELRSFGGDTAARMNDMPRIDDLAAA
jgi:hypothetical protein